jgi:hypothetical protein
MPTGERAPALLALQQTHGNRYVQRVVTGIQAKLVVGQPGDKYEQEADRVADEVMRMPEPHVQRECSNYSENEFVQTKPTLSILRSITNIRSSIPHVQRYGANVHQTLTERWGREIFPEDYGDVASEIARFDQLLDEGWTHPTLTTLASFRFSGYDSPHFLDRNAALARVESSISSVNRRDFGGALHSFQDSFSHRFPPGAGYNNEDNVGPADHSAFERALVEPARVLQHVYPDTLSGRGAALRHVVLGHYPDHFKGPGQTDRDTEMEAETKRLLRRFEQRYTERMRGLEEYRSEQSSTGRPHGTMAPPPRSMRGLEEHQSEQSSIGRPPGTTMAPPPRIIPRKEITPTKAEGQTPQVTSSIESKINSLKSGGQPLSKETRNFFEPRFGSDFSGVRIHADSNANQLARSLNAKAFTRGNDIVFGSGWYKPENSSGKRLLGHELTHVVQQNIGGVEPKLNSGQAKLVVGSPNDKYEQESDRVADAVMRMPEPGVQRQAEEEETEEEEIIQTKPLAEQITPLIQRQSEEVEEPIMMKPLVQRQADGSFRASHSLERRLAASQRGGRPLSAEVRSFMEPRFGVDFRGVRVHTESDAAQMNRELNAHAFTHGQDMYFETGKYSPTTVEGKRLLAHELTHVTQQAEILQRQRRYAGSRVRHRIQRDGGGTPDDPRPEVTQLDITGHYEAEATSGIPITVQLNQAGLHFEGWYQERVLGQSGQRSTLGQRRIRGDVQRAHSNRIEATYTLVGIEQGRLIFNLRGDNMEMKMESTIVSDIYFRRISRSSRVPTEAVRGADFEHQSVLEASINAPLNTRDEQMLAAMCEILRNRINEYLLVARFGGPGGPESQRVNRASGINRCVDLIFTRFAPQQEPLVRRRMQEILATAMYGAGRVTRPYWDWLQIVRAQNPDQTQDLERYLGLRQVGSEGNHRYRWRYSIGTTESREGLGTQPRGRGQAGRTRGSTILGGSILLGTLTIEKLEPEPWTQSYTMGMVQVSAGVSRGIVHDATTRWTEFTTPFAWEGGNFEGPIAMARATAAATARTGGGQGVGSGAGSGFLTFYGDGSNAPITVDASGLITIMGSYIGAELSVSGGYIAGGEEEVVRRCQPPEAIREQVHYRPQGVAHFALDDPSLTDEGRRAIRRFCATHLTSLQNPSSSLRVEGFTDPLGTPQRNYELSRLRAVNTLQAIRDIMGNRLGIPQGQQEAEGLGETPSYLGILAELRALGQELPSHEDLVVYEAPHWRKVEVSIGGQVLLALHGG